MNVYAMTLVVLAIANAVIGKAFLPDQRLNSKLLLRAKGEAAFDVLQGLFQRRIRGGCDDEMKVVRHGDEFVQQETIFLAVVIKDVQKKPGHTVFSEEGITQVRGGGHEKRADLLRSISQEAPALKFEPFCGRLSPQTKS